MTGDEARQLVAELQARGYKVAAYFETPVDGTPERWRVVAYGRKRTPIPIFADQPTTKIGPGGVLIDVWEVIGYR